MRFALLILLTSLAYGLLGAKAVDRRVVNADPIVLPPFVVETELAEFRTWSKITSEHFVIYTDERDDLARSLARDLELLRAASIKLIGRAWLRADRMVFVLPSFRSDWTRLEKRGGIEWDPAARGICSRPITLCLVKSMSGMERFIARSDERDAFYSMIGAHLLQQTGHPAMLWLERGLVQLFTNATVSGNLVKLGNAAEGEESALRARGFLPWNGFFRVGLESPEFVKRSEVKRFDGQCSLFVRFLLTQPDSTWRASFEEWTGHLSSGKPASEKTFLQIFGKSWDEWQDLLQGFLESGKTYSLEYTFKAEEIPGGLKTQEVVPSEMRELFLITQVLCNSPERIIPLLDHVLKKGLKSDCLRSLLVAACLRHDKELPAMEHLRKLMNAGSQIPQVYEEASRLAFRLRGRRLSLETVLGPEDAEIRALAEKALSLEPGLTTAKFFLALSYALEKTPSPACVPTLRSLIYTADDHPIRFDLQMVLAIAQLRLGNLIEARAGCQAIIEESGGVYGNPVFNELKERLRLD